MKGIRNVNTIDNGYFLGLLKAKQKELLSTVSNRDEILIEATADEIDSLQQQLCRVIIYLATHGRFEKLSGPAVLSDGFLHTFLLAAGAFQPCFLFK